MIIVYGSMLSPFVRKVLMVAGEKGVPVEQRPGGAAGGTEFAEASPFGKIPAMRVPGAGMRGGGDGSDFVISDSSAIAHYFEAEFPEPRLLPADPRARGEAIWLEEFSDTILFPAAAVIFFNRVVAPLFMGRAGDAAAAAKAENETLPPILDWLDGRIGERTFLVGETLTLADIAIAMPFGNLPHAQMAFDPARWGNILRWSAAINARPSVAAHHDGMGAVIASARAKAEAAKQTK